jgi:hypothetical protein
MGWVEALELDAGVGGGEAPGDGAGRPVPLAHLGGHLARHNRAVAQPPVEACVTPIWFNLSSATARLFRPIRGNPALWLVCPLLYLALHSVPLVAAHYVQRALQVVMPCV